jgi:ferric-dicitrate binding protein FerR (iron transport regulator)
MMQELQLLAKQEEEIENKVKHSEEHIQQFRNVLKTVDKMKVEQFQQLQAQVTTPNNSKHNSRSLSQAILLYAANHHQH